MTYAPIVRYGLAEQSGRCNGRRKARPGCELEVDPVADVNEKSCPVVGRAVDAIVGPFGTKVELEQEGPGPVVVEAALSEKN